MVRASARRAILSGTLLLAISIAGAAPFVPASDDQVLERLPTATGGPALRELRALRQELTRQPDDLPLAIRIARRYAELGRVSGDPRYAGYAQAALAAWWDRANPPLEVLLMRATLRQRIHDFDAALADLAIVLKADPRNGQARLTRATILQVRGAFAEALSECMALRGLAQELVWAACAYSVSGASGQLRKSYEALQAALADSPQAKPEVRQWVLSILAEMAARADLRQQAEAYFREALILDPADHYTLGAYADFLLDAGRAGEVLKLLRARSQTDALLLRYALALKETGSPELNTEIDRLSARFAASRLRGDRVHQREEARFALQLLGDAKAALQLAKENWTVQKEVSDVRILLEAARAASDVAILRDARDWLARSGMEDTQLARAAR